MTTAEPNPRSGVTARATSADLDQANRRAEFFAQQHAALLDLVRIDHRDLPSAFTALVERLGPLLGSARASIWLFDANRQSMVCHVLRHLGTGLVEQGLALPTAAFPAYFQALEQHRMLAAHDAQHDPRLPSSRRPTCSRLASLRCWTVACGGRVG